MSKLRIAPILLVGFLAHGAALGDGLYREIREHLDAVPAACPERLETLGPPETAWCMKVELSLKALKRSLQDFADRKEHRLLGRWETDHGFKVHRLLRQRRDLFILAFERENQRLVVLQPFPCFQTASTAGPRPVGVGYRRPVELLKPSFPAAGRVARVEGVVVLQALVDKNGSVADACVLHAEPPGYGYEEESIRVVRQWRYEPFLEEGEPVEVRQTIVIDYEIR